MTLIKVKVTDTTISTREGVSKSTGNPYKMNSQNITVELNGEVRKVDLTIPDNVGAYAPGNYTIDPIEMIEIGRFGFDFRRYHEIKLIPATPAMAAMSKPA